MKFTNLILICAAFAGCARFQPKPLSPENNAASLENRSLTNAALKLFLEKNLRHEINGWPQSRWDFDMLTLATFYYQPDLEVARADWQVAQAGIKTAGGRPNPTLSLVPGYDTTHSIPSPWLPAVSFDLPLETAGKRAKRIAAAEHQSESARLGVATIAWKARSELRSGLLNSAVAQRRVELLQGQVSIEEKIVALLEQQAQAGAISSFDLTAPRIALQKAQLELASAQSQLAEARTHVAAAIGIPLHALEEVALAFDPLKDFGLSGDLTSAGVRRAALQSRTDILGALADYAEAEATLRLEIAKQFPDVHLNPGYQFDTGDNKWTLGISFELPVLNQNQGPIAEAAARRTAAAARFNAVQAKALAEIERAVEVLRATKMNSSALETLAITQAKQRDAVAAQFQAGAADQLDWLNAQLEFAVAGLVQLEGKTRLLEAAGALEDAVQRPLSGDMMSAAEKIDSRMETKNVGKKESRR